MVENRTKEASETWRVVAYEVQERRRRGGWTYEVTGQVPSSVHQHVHRSSNYSKLINVVDFKIDIIARNLLSKTNL
jgi:hypothetical protein